MPDSPTFLNYKMGTPCTSITVARDTLLRQVRCRRQAHNSAQKEDNNEATTLGRERSLQEQIGV
jgi:hypothetical protein